MRLCCGFQELVQTKQAVKERIINQPVQLFTKNFIAKVLKGEVDFETRLKLENEVRELNDKDILITWQKFTAAKSEIEAQMAVKNLLALLSDKL